MHYYAQSSGKLVREGALLGVGYAGGNCGKTPQGKNNPLMQSVHGVGPLPQGYYKIVGPPVDSPNTGKFTLQLVACLGTQTYGRGLFRLHGDTVPPGNASEGCIVQDRPVREAVWANVQAGDDDLCVVASDDQLPAAC